MGRLGLMAALTSGNIKALEGLAAAGAAGFKLFLDEVSGFLAPPRGESLKAALKIIAGTGLCCAVHAEEGPLIAARVARLKKEGRLDPPAHRESRPVGVEAEAIRRVADRARETGVRLHICHLSSGPGAEEVQRAKARAADITAETAPHYLLLDSAMMGRSGSLFKVNPPLRAAAHREALWAAISEGVVKIIASDHAPILRKKTKDNIWKAASRFCGGSLLP